jgi:AcrR family transcriptional regulator
MATAEPLLPGSRRSSTRRTKRHELGDRSREEILDAASSLMSAKGFSATSMSELAKESGLPPSSIYWHFESKAGVLGAVMERGARRYFAEVAAISQVWGDSPDENFRRLMELSNAVVRSHPEFLRLFMLLLLGSEGHESQSEVVRRVRELGREHLHTALKQSFEPWGSEVSEAIADELADTALVQFDGVFLASQVDTTDGQARLVRQMSDAIFLLAKAFAGR